MRTGAIAVLMLMLYGCAASTTGPRTGSQVAQRGTKPLLITLTLQYVVERKHDDRPRSRSRP